VTVTVAICTSGRDSIVHTVRSLANQSQPADELLIVDQSGRSSAKQAIEEAKYPFPYRVIEQTEKGLSKARNAALEALQTDWVFFTDDDCVVSLDLVYQFHKVITQFPEAAFLAGTCIRPLDYNPVTHDVPGILISKQIELNAETTMAEQDFMGACLAFRRDLWEKVGQFDPYLGAGTDLPAGEECDYIFRAIINGFTGRANARLVVFHEYGARKRPPDDTNNGRIGNAAVLWKMKKIGDPIGIKLAQRIRPYGPKKVLLSALTFGSLYEVHKKMYAKSQELYKKLDADFTVTDGVLTATAKS